MFVLYLSSILVVVAGLPAAAAAAAAAAASSLQLHVRTGNVSLEHVCAAVVVQIANDSYTTLSLSHGTQDSIELCNAIDLPANESYFISKCSRTKCTHTPLTPVMHDHSRVPSAATGGHQ